MKKLTKKEIEFLTKVEETYPDPWGSMAAQAILFNEREILKFLKAKLKPMRGNSK
jgi:hypothetical protein